MMANRNYVIRTALQSIGVAGSYIGRPCMVEVMERVMENEDLLPVLSEKVYPEVARRYNMDVEKMKCNFRTIVAVCCKEKNLPNFIALVGRPINYTPSVAEFIALVTDGLRRRGY